MQGRNVQITHKILGFMLKTITQHPILAIGLLLITVVFVGSQLTKLTFDNSPDGFFMQGDPNLSNYENFKDKYQTDEFSLILLSAPERWNKTFIADVQNTIAKLEQLPHVIKVSSITNARNIEGVGDDIIIDDLFSGDHSDSEIQAIQKKAVAHPHYSKLYVTKDGNHVAIIVESKIINAQVDYKVTLVENIRNIVNTPSLKDYKPRIVGAPVLDSDVRNIVQQESVILTLLTFSLIIIGFWKVFRSAYAMLMAFVILSSSLVTTFGAMASMGFSYTLLTPIVPTFLMSVGIGPLMFLLSGFCYRRSNGANGKEALSSTFIEVGATCCLTVITTSGALLAFSASDIVPVYQVGCTMAIGLIITLIVTLFWFPIFLNEQNQHRLKLGGVALSKRLNILMQIGEWVIVHYKALLLSFMAVCGIAMLGLTQLKTDYQYLGIFKESTRIHQDYTYVDEILPTSASIELIFKGSTENAIKSPDVLKAMDKLTQFISMNSQLPVKIYSLADVVKELNQAFHNNEKAYYRIPDDQALIAQELFLFESSDQNEFSQITNWNYQETRMIIRVPNVTDSQYQALFAVINQGIAEIFTKKEVTVAANDHREPAPTLTDTSQITVTKTGLVQLWVTIGNYLIESQVTSILLAFGAVTLAMMAIFKSVVTGGIFGLLNLSVIVIVLGLMGALGIYLDPYTVLIAGIALGILDDDTIHFVKSVQDDVNRGASIEDAIRHTYAQAGQAIFYTTIILVVGFSFNLFSSIASLTKFGLLVSLTLFLGLIVEFLITPGLILLLGPRILKSNNVSSAECEKRKRVELNELLTPANSYITASKEEGLS
jgi:predicted RND superfamily exporter protein